MSRNPEVGGFWPPEAEKFAELHENFRQGLEEKLADTIKERVAKKVQEYLEEKVGQARIDQAVDHLFLKILEGASFEEMDSQLKRVSKETLETAQ
jgi:FKBP-type peptidyl-prolyl cis-trans isomerase (trigger factor)